jgi:hypothetical protein
VINDDPERVVDLYLNQDPFEHEESLDAERKKRYEAWRAQFLPDREDIWNDSCVPEP